MKKTYETPKAVKLDFDYNEIVTTSGIPDSNWKCTIGSTSCTGEHPGNSGHSFQKKKCV